MKIRTEKEVAKFQEGGAMPAGGGGQDPIAQLVAVAQQALEGGDCEAAMAVAQGLVELASGGAGGGGGAPQGPPAQKNGGTLQPVFKAGGKLSKMTK